MITLGGARRGAWAKSGVPTARDYVQDGLIAMWDGIENAGWGTHSATATMWKDLVGSANLIPTGSLMWGDNSPEFEGGLYFNVPESFSLDGGDITCESIFNSKGNVSNQGVIGLGHTNRRFLWLLVGNPPINSNASVTWQYKGSGVVRVHYNQGVLSGDVATALVSESGIVNAYRDGQIVTITPDVPVGTVAYRDFNMVGAIQNYNALRGGIKTVRIYNRALTAAEIAANYAIDRARFNLP